jgi:hypothetical protein
MTNLPATLSTLATQISSLTEKLAPVSEDHVARSIRSLLAAGLSLPSGMTVEAAPEIYAFALAGVPAIGVQKATAGVIRGEYDINKGFVPKPPEFAAIARLETKAIRDDLVRLREKAATLQEVAKPREKTSEEQMERIRQLHAQIKAAHAESKAGERFNPIPADMTPEQLAYWEQIQAIKDAPTITEEQRAMRRKIASSMAGATQAEQKDAAE